MPTRRIAGQLLVPLPLAYQWPGQQAKAATPSSYPKKTMLCCFWPVLLLPGGAAARTQALYAALKKPARTTVLLSVPGVSSRPALAFWLFARSPQTRQAARKREQTFYDSLERQRFESG